MEMDPITLERMVRSLEIIATTSQQVEARFEATGKRVQQVGRDLKNVELPFISFKRLVTSSFDELGKHYTFFIKTEFLRSTEDALEKAKARWKAYGEEVHRHMTEARGALGGAGGALGMSGKSGAFSGASSMFSSMMGSMPFGIGGVIGMMLYGRKRAEEFDAAAVKVTRILDQVGQGGKAADAVRGRVEAMHYAFGSFGEELEAVIDQFREFGMGAEIFEDTGKDAGALGRDLVGVVTALEMANRLAPGSIAKQIGEIFEAGGESRAALLDDFMDLDRVAQSTHVSIERLMSTMTQSASSLRVQRQGVTDLAEGYKKLFNALSSGVMRGAPDQAVGAAAMRGVQAAAGGIAGLSEGLQAELSRRMGGPQGVEGIVAMQEELSGKGSGRVFEQLGELAREVTGGGSRREQIFALEKIAPSLGMEGARAVVDMMSGGSTLADVQDSIKDPQEKILAAMTRRSREESAWEKTQRQVLMHMAAIGASLLTVTLSGFNVLTKEIGALLHPTDSKARGEAERAMLEGAEIQAKAFESMAGSVGGIFKAAGRGVGTDIPLPSFLTDAATAGAQRKQEAAQRRAADRAQTEATTVQAQATLGSVVANPDELPGALAAQLRGQILTATRGTRAGSLAESYGQRSTAVDFLNQHKIPFENVQGPEGWRIKVIVEKETSDRAEAPQ